MKDKKTHLRPFIFGTNLMMLPTQESSEKNDEISILVAIVLIITLIAVITIIL